MEYFYDWIYEGDVAIFFETSFFEDGSYLCVKMDWEWIWCKQEEDIE